MLKPLYCIKKDKGKLHTLERLNIGTFDVQACSTNSPFWVGSCTLCSLIYSQTQPKDLVRI